MRTIGTPVMYIYSGRAGSVLKYFSIALFYFYLTIVLKVLGFLPNDVIDDNHGGLSELER